MRPLPFLLLVAVTSAVALGLGVWLLRLPATALRRAVGMTLEILGFGVAFFVLNVAVAVLAAVVLRRVSGFVSLYASNDMVLLLCSLLQGTIFATWRQLAGRRGD
jgi:hypothetical protein